LLATSLVLQIRTAQHGPIAGLARLNRSVDDGTLAP
jgi:hypothetical protein